MGSMRRGIQFCRPRRTGDPRKAVGRESAQFRMMLVGVNWQQKSASACGDHSDSAALLAIQTCLQRFAASTACFIRATQPGMTRR